MRCLLAVILAVLVAAEGKVVPASDVENQQTVTQPFQLSEHRIESELKEAQNFINNLSAQIQQLSLPNQEEFSNTLKQQSTNFANNVQAYFKNITDKITERHRTV